MKNCTPLWREAFEVKMYKTPQLRTTFGSCDVCAPLWREAHFQVKMYKTHHSRTTFGSSDARRCGAKHVSKSKSKCTKHHMFAPLLEVRMLKKCTPLWREAHCEVKMYKTLGVRTTFGGSDVVSLHYTTLHYTTLHNTTTTTTQLHNYTTTLHYTKLHSTTLHYTKLHSTTLHYLPLHFTTLHYTTLHYNYNYTTTLHYTPLH